MSRAIKTVLVLLAVPIIAALALGVGVTIAAPMLFERFGVARTIEASLLDATGHRVLLSGQPRLQLLPQPSVEFGPLTIDPGPDGETPLAQVGLLRVQVAGLPLFSGRAELMELTLDGMQWSPTDGDSNNQPGRHDTTPDATSASPPNIRDAQAQLRYPSGGPRWSLFALGDGPIEAGGSGQLDAFMTMTGSAPNLQGTLQLAATIESSADLTVIRIGNLQLRGSDLAAGAGRDLELALDADAVYQLQNRSWQIEQLRLTSGTLRIDGDLTRLHADQAPVISGSFSVAGFDLRTWMQSHGLKLDIGSPTTLRCTAAQGHFVLEDDELLLEPLALRIDDTNAVGALWARVATAPWASLALALDRIDLDPYLPSYLGLYPTLTTPGSAAADCGLASDLAVAVADLPPLPTEAEVVARVEAGSMRLDGLSYGRVGVDAQARGTRFGADIEAADFYNGQLAARIDRDAGAGAAPRQTLVARAVDVDVAALLTDLQGRTPISGVGNVSADLNGNGLDVATIKADLSGSVAVEIRDGRLLDLDVAPLVTAAGGDAADAAMATKFSILSATATGTKGQFFSQDISARSPTLQVAGQGRFDVPAESLDLDLQATFVEPPEGGGLRGIGGIRVPLRIAGDWQQPAWEADFGPALREGARRALDRNSDALKQLEDRTGIKGLEQGLRGLLGF